MPSLMHSSMPSLLGALPASLMPVPPSSNYEDLNPNVAEFVPVQIGGVGSEGEIELGEEICETSPPPPRPTTASIPVANDTGK